MTVGTNQPATWSARRWIGARERCASATICTICDSSVSRPTLSARMMKLPDWFSVPAIDLGAWLLGDRHGFAGHERFVERGAAFENDAVDRHLLAGTDAQAVAGMKRIDLDLVLAAVGTDAARRLGRELQQRLDRARGRLARAQLQHLAEQHQHGDDGGRPRNRPRPRRHGRGRWRGKICGASVPIRL